MLFKRRFFAICGAGLILLTVYQFVFMTKTSAIRDWNHLHAIKWSTRAAQGYINSIIPEIASMQDINIPFTEKKLETHLPKNNVDYATLNGAPLEISKYTQLLRTNLSEPVYIRGDDIGILHLSEHVDLKSQIKFSSKLYKCLIYVIPRSYTPNFGVFETEVPVFFVYKQPSALARGKVLKLEPSSVKHSYKEFTIKGIQPQTVVVGCDSHSAEEFLQLAILFKLLSKQMKLVRSVKFIQFELGMSQLYNFAQDNAYVYMNMNLDAKLPTASPLLLELLNEYVQQFDDAHLISDASTGLVNMPTGSIDIFLNQKLQVISPALSPHTLQLAGLLLVDLVQSPILPFSLAEYTNLLHLNNTKFEKSMCSFKDHIRKEYTWYEIHKKWRILSVIKVLNYRLQNLESIFKSSDGHLLFTTNSEHSDVVFNKGYAHIGAQLLIYGLESLLEIMPPPHPPQSIPHHSS